MTTEEIHELLGMLTAGELTADDPAVKELFASSPENAARVQEALALGQSLRRARDWHSATRDEPADNGDSGQAARIAELVRARAASELGPRRLSGAQRLGLASAAAVLLAVVTWAIAHSSGRAEPSGLQGNATLGSEVRLLSPGDGAEVEAFDRFEWSCDRAGDVRFDIRVYAVDSEGAPGPLVDEATRISGSVWMPETERTEAWPEEVFWQVSVLEYQVVVVSSPLARVRRSSH